MKTWEELTDEERLAYAGIERVALLVAIAEEHGKTLNRGIAWATHKDAPEFAAETSNLGQVSEDGRWYIGFIEADKLDVIDPSNVETPPMHVRTCVYLKGGYAERMLHIDDAKAIYREVLAKKPKVNAKGGKA